MKSMSGKPNLFDFATSELSQDAFLAWLIQYADCDNADDATGAYAAAHRFLYHAFGLNSIEKPMGNLRVKVERQYRHIDVYAEIAEVNSEKKYALILEDKAGTTVHDDQLTRYRETVKSEGYGDSQLICIYCQTRNESIKKCVEESGFHQLGRRELIAILKDTSGNQIIESFVLHLERLEDLTNKWITELPYDEKGDDKWSWLAWQGFFMALRERLGDGDLAYVPNPSGGFLGFWWHWRPIDGGSLYLQLEEGKACFKVEVDEAVDAGEKKWAWHSLVIEKATEAGVCAVKPSVMRKGSWMTVAVLKENYRKVKRDGCIDMDATIAKLKQMEDVVFRVTGS